MLKQKHLTDLSEAKTNTSDAVKERQQSINLMKQILYYNLLSVIIMFCYDVEVCEKKTIRFFFLGFVKTIQKLCLPLDFRVKRSHHIVPYRIIYM